MRIDYLGLEAFVAISERGSFQRAAEFLNLSQTALSHRIKKVEADLGVQLLLRTTREVSLTRAGQELLPTIRKLLEELTETYADVRHRSQQQLTRLRFACLPTISQSHLPDILAQFVKKRPNVSLQLFDVPVRQTFDLVQSGEVDFGITIVTANRPDIKMKPLMSEPYMLLVRHDHPFAQLQSIDRAALRGQPLARIMTQSTNRQLLDDALADYRHEILWRYEVQNPATALSLVSAGMAMTILPRMAVKFKQANLVALPFEDVSMTRTLSLITRRGMPPTDTANELIELITEELGKLDQDRYVQERP